MPTSHADLVLRGGHVHTVDPARPRAEALAVAGGRIVAVGTEADVATFVGPTTRVVELRDRLVVPGFIDAHVHAVSSGTYRRLVDQHDQRGIDTYLAAAVAWAEANPTAPWIHGGGWTMSDFPAGRPRRELLDAVLPDRPVMLSSRDGHDGWVNSRALELAGIDESTQDPPNGAIARDPDGRPIGVLHEAAMFLVERLIPEPTAEDLETALIEAQAYLHSLGITGWQDAFIDPAYQAAYESVAGRGELTARVVGAMGWDPQRDAGQIEELVGRRDRVGPIGRFRAGAVKIFGDGIVENFTAAVLDPYLGSDGRPTTNRGMSMVEAGPLAEAATAIDAAGLQLHVHVIGERAVREALDAVAVARRANGPSDTRPHLAHIQIIHPEDRPRFRELGVIANAQPYWAMCEETQEVLNIPFLGPERSSWQYPFRSLLDAGATLAMGSDWSVSTPNPLREIEIAVTRIDDEARDHEPLYPEERISLAEGIAAFTAGSALVNHAETTTGSITVGKLADLVVIDRDLFGDAGPIGDGRVLATFIEGVPVFEDPSL